MRQNRRERKRHHSPQNLPAEAEKRPQAALAHLHAGFLCLVYYFMIPTYLVVKELGLLDSVWSLIIPGLINTYYVIILRTAMIGAVKG